MGTKFWKVMCDEHGIGGSGEYFGDKDSQLDRINVIYHEDLGDKYNADHPVNHTRGRNLGQRPLQKGLAPILLPLPCRVAAFVVNSEPHTGARPSVRLCVRP